jgi:hypothetical protein
MMARSQQIPGNIDPLSELFPTAPSVKASKTAVDHPPKEPTKVVPNFFAAAKITPEQKSRSTKESAWVPRKLEALLQPQERAAGHPFSEVLHQLAMKGMSVNCGPEWQWSTIEVAVVQGVHHSVLEPVNVQLIHEDIKYRV